MRATSFLCRKNSPLGRRAQIILEFMIVMSIAIIIGIVYLAISTDLLLSTSEQQRLNALDDVGYRVQDELILAADVNDGYARSISLPRYADRFTYNIVFAGGACDPTVESTSFDLSSGTVSRSYDTPAYRGCFHITPNGTNMIRKDGNITVNLP